MAHITNSFSSHHIQRKSAMSNLCKMQIHINGQETFFLNEKVLSTYSEKMKKIVKQERRRTQKRNLDIEIDDFPGGPDGFELVARFCHDNGGITITVTNVSLLHCCAVFLGMTEKVSTFNLLQQTEAFLEGMFYWSWKDILACLKSCESFFAYAESFGLLEKLIFALLAKIAQNSDLSLITTSSSTSSSPETASGFRFSSSCKTTPESIKPSSSSKPWWFDDLTILPPKIIEKVITSLGVYMNNNKSLILTKFLLQYLKLATHRKGYNTKGEFLGLADTACHGVISAGKKAFSCRSLFWVLRILSGFGISKECKLGLERLIGEVLDESKLDDLLVSGNKSGVYDVNLVIRLVRVFVSCDGVSVQKLKKVGRLIDEYLCEISPDQNLKISKFLGVAESVPDSARDSFDGVFRAIDIYLESNPTLSSEERSKLCRCLNYQKLSLEACKELAKNPKIPPRITIQALISQQSKVPASEFGDLKTSPSGKINNELPQMANLYNIGCDDESFAEENKYVKMNLQRMQRRVMELEKVYREMRGQMSRIVRNNVFGPQISLRTYYYSDHILAPMALMLDNCEGILLSLDSHKSVPAPFLTKTYQLVDDPSTDHIVSWGEDDTTFVVWRPPEFARDLLPNYFKHNNFSSFVRQLNTYGFRKIVPDRWEFANEFFKKGEKHLLCEIHRRKTAQPQVSLNHHHHHHHHPHSHHQIGINGPSFFPFSSTAGRVSISPSDSDDNPNNWSSCDSPPLTSSPRGPTAAIVGGVSLGNFGGGGSGGVTSSVTALSEDNERLRRSNSMLMSELAHMRKLYNDIIYFVQNHVKPVAPSNVSYPAPSPLLLCNANNGTGTTNNASSVVLQKPLNQLLGYYPSGTTHVNNPKVQLNNLHANHGGLNSSTLNSPSTTAKSSVTILEERNTTTNGCKTKLFGVPLLSKKRLHPEYGSGNATNNMENNKARLVLEKDDLGFNLMPPSTC